MRTIHIEKYYTSMEHLLKVYDIESRKMAFDAKNIPEYGEWKKSVRAKICDITGLNKMERCPLKPELLESEQCDGYRRDKLIIQTEPDVWMPFYILIPDCLKKDKKGSSIIATHGHFSAGKCSVSGRKDIPAVKEQIAVYNYDYGLKLAKEGYVVFCPDARAFGERREWTRQTDNEEDFLTSTCVQLNHMAIYLGQSVTGMWTWDLMRLVDYIETRNDCNAGRIGCVGLSGGGMQALWLTAMDDRVKCAIVSGYFYGYKDALLKLSDNCGCNYVPHLLEYVDMGDIGALIAPRPLLIESGNKDPLNGERGLLNVTEQLEITIKAYELFNARDNIWHYVGEGGHRWYGEKSSEFISRFL